MSSNRLALFKRQGDFPADDFVRVVQTPARDKVTRHAAAGHRNATGVERQPPVRAAQYVRMSTDHQQYSTENQAEVIAEYARVHHIAIVCTADEGKSGLRLEGRDQLQRLIAEVESGTADFEVVLVYDVSRWGRFQDAECRHGGNLHLGQTVLDEQPVDAVGDGNLVIETGDEDHP